MKQRNRLLQKRLQLRPVALSLLCAGLAPAMAQVLPVVSPQLGAIVGGVTMTQGVGVMNIVQPLQRGIVNWQSFSIGANGVVSISQPSTSAVLLNRVVGDGMSIQASRIDGTLRTTLASNPALPGGSVFLINPSGIVFGKGASVNVGGLVASTLDIANSNFMPAGSEDKAIGRNEQLLFFGPEGSMAQVKVEGGASITTTSPNGTVALLGGVVRNEGEINVARGSVGLVSASKVTLNLDFDGDGLTTFNIPADGQTKFKLADLKAADPTAVAQLANSGKVTADGGRVVLMAAANVDARQLVVSQTGVIQARSLSTRNGEIVLDASHAPGGNNEIQIGGTIDAGTGASEAGASGSTGGAVTLRGDYIRLASGSVNASGSAGGGTVTVQGASAVSMAPDAGISADATGANGAGGKIDIDGGFTHISGSLSARGAGSGNGGTIGTSGDQLEVAPAARIDAAGGATGANGSWNVLSRGTLNVDDNVAAYNPNGYGEAADGTHVSAATIGATLGRSTDVNLRTGATEGNADVVFQNGVQVVKSEGRDARLTVDSVNGIAMNNGASITSTAGALDVNFDANADANEIGGAIRMDNASIATNGGSIRFYGQGNADTGRAVGGMSVDDGGTSSGVAGITLTGSSLSTCATGTVACGGSGGSGGSGVIVLRGQGVSQQASGAAGYYVSSDGVDLRGSSLTTGSGGIAIDGQGGIGANGVLLAGNDGQATQLRTGTGDVSVTGSSRSWTTDDPGAVYGSTVTPNGSMSAADVTVAVTAGVALRGAVIDAGGRVGIDGTGANLQGLTANDTFMTSAQAANNGDGVGYGAGDGVNINGGSITAGKGRDVSIAGTAGGQGFSVRNGAVTQGQAPSAVSISMEAGETVRAEGGSVSIDGRGGDVTVARVLSRGDLPAGLTNALIDTSSTTGAGGTVNISGRNVLVSDVYNDLTTIDAGGAGQAGTIDIRGSNAIAIDASASLRADASSANGNGGTVRVIAGDTLRGYGSLSARGGSAGGNGGTVETSAPHFELLGLRVDASAPMGTAGTWVIDPYNVNIAHSSLPGSLPGNPFDPVANSTIQDNDINTALDSGTSVTITTGTGGIPTDGNITFAAGASIVRSKGAAPLTFELDAAHSIGTSGGASIQSNSGALNVVFNAGVGGQGGAINYNGVINTNGGNVTMNADAGASSNPAVTMNGTSIDTRTTALGDAGPGGSVRISGRRTLPPSIFNTQATVDLTGISIQSSTGDVSISGVGQHGDGVRIQGGSTPSQILTTSGDIDILGVGASYTYSQSQLAVQSVEINGATLRSVDGNIGIRGLVTPGPQDGPSGGVLLAGNALVTTLGVGNIDIAGESQANGTGVNIGKGAQVRGNRDVVLRASNDGTSDAVVIGGNVHAGRVLDLRPGGVDAATGNAVDRTANPVTLGGTAAAGFAVSADEFTRLDAPTIVVGSNAHAADINVVGPLALSSALTLQNEGGGNINLGGALTAPTIGLLSRGNITQTAAAPITAGTLMARSTGGSVLLDQAANNVSAATVGGGAAGAFRYVDVDTVQLGSVSVTGFDAGGNAPQVASATSMAADTVFVRTLSGDLLLGTNVSSTSGTDLVAGARLQNLGGYTITGAPWRVWADTWVGETRGGLQGSGVYPNLYHCAYSGLCAVSIPAGANHFIYTQQPVATVVIGNASRPFGFPNPLFSYGIGGLILGDTGRSFLGFVSSPALPGSLPGLYPINGAFTSAEGYAVNVVPGNLLVSGLPNLPLPDALRDLPSTWLYDRNMGPPPICFATGPLDGDRAAQGGDVLAREWSRVRSRPNLSSCVDTDKRNGCSDF